MKNLGWFILILVIGVMLHYVAVFIAVNNIQKQIGGKRTASNTPEMMGHVLPTYTVYG